jgi:ATP-dependent DNA helicase RecQ
MTIPKNIEAYYQETGRAGRDGAPANALMIYGMRDAALQRSFIESSHAPDNQKRIEHQKLNALLGLCETSGCRRQVLLDYFSGQAARNEKTPTIGCNYCDTCDTPPVTFDGTIIAQKALSCVYRTDQIFGVSYLIDVLLGKDTDRIQQFGHQNLSTFGIGTELSRTAWQSMFRQLVARNLLMVDMVGHGGLKITPQGQQFLKEKQTLALRQYTGKVKTTREQTPRIAIPDLAPDDATLFSALKETRLALSKAQKVPPYIICHDKTLREIATIKPTSEAELMQISGMGARKINKYGAEFIQTVSNSKQ